MATKKPAMPMPRATRQGTSKTKRTPLVATPKTTKKAVTPKPKKTVITPRKRLDVSKMTPAQKQAYYNQPGYDNY